MLPPSSEEDEDEDGQWRWRKDGSSASSAVVSSIEGLGRARVRRRPQGDDGGDDDPSSML
ncbi:hypothetical protein ACHAXA_011624 [Cyclostephanos tholiformis]|uniref:Uncharacterized protein n=1 Tax=Cyclostephanos tholiformis TaxID=382380 RepID=A0ABD3RVA0_9STRA